MAEINSMKWSSFEAELEKSSNANEVLNAYLALDKEFVDPTILDKIASRLLDFSEKDYAMKFIEMAETRRSNNELADRIGSSIDKIFFENSVNDISKNLGSIARAITTGKAE